MQPDLVRKFKTLALICLFTCFAGVIFQLISEERVDYHSVLVGLPLGLAFGLLELFLFRGGNWFRQWSFTKILFFKTLLYTAIIYLVSAAIAIMSGLFEGHKWSEAPAFLLSPNN
jgi:adenylate cyclase